MPATDRAFEPVLPPQRILVPVDFSEPSLGAWALAQYLSRAVKAAVEAVFVYEPGAGSADPVIPADLLNEARKKALEEELRGKLGKDVSITIQEGFASEEILGVASRGSGADMIVMGTHGRTGAARVLLGSVAESLSRLSPVPLLTLRGSWKPVRSILAPVNFAPYALRGLASAAKMAAALGARLDVLYVGKPPSAADKKNFDKTAEAIAASFSGRAPSLIIRGGHPVNEIVEASKAYDLVILVAHRKSILEDIVLGTTAERVIRHSAVPVLSLPA